MFGGNADQSRFSHSLAHPNAVPSSHVAMNSPSPSNYSDVDSDDEDSPDDIFGDQGQFFSQFADIGGGVAAPSSQNSNVEGGHHDDNDTTNDLDEIVQPPGAHNMISHNNSHPLNAIVPHHHDGLKDESFITSRNSTSQPIEVSTKLL